MPMQRASSEAEANCPVPSSCSSIRALAMRMARLVGLFPTGSTCSASSSALVRWRINFCEPQLCVSKEMAMLAWYDSAAGISKGSCAAIGMQLVTRLWGERLGV